MQLGITFGGNIVIRMAWLMDGWIDRWPQMDGWMDESMENQWRIACASGMTVSVLSCGKYIDRCNHAFRVGIVKSHV